MPRNCTVFLLPRRLTRSVIYGSQIFDSHKMADRVIRTVRSKATCSFKQLYETWPCLSSVIITIQMNWFNDVIKLVLLSMNTSLQKSKCIVWHNTKDKITMHNSQTFTWYSFHRTCSGLQRGIHSQHSRDSVSHTYAALGVTILLPPLQPALIACQSSWMYLKHSQIQ